MTINDETALAVLNAFGNIVSKTANCGHCDGHGTLGDDYCDMCGGSGWAIVHSEQEAMKLALEMVFGADHTPQLTQPTNDFAPK